MSGSHPLQIILRGHIGQVSQRKLGNDDLSWVVTNSGQMKTEGSSTWSNICRAWEGLKSHIKARHPVNKDEWLELLLWRPHVNNILPKKVKCFTGTQIILRDAGLLRMGDIMEIYGSFSSWAALEGRGLPAKCQATFLSLIDNLVQVMVLDNSPRPHAFFVESVNTRGPHWVWKYMLQPEHCTASWIPYMDCTSSHTGVSLSR